jgi:hypothetical protein
VCGREVVDDFEVIEIEERTATGRLLRCASAARIQMLLKSRRFARPVGIVIRLILHLLLGALAIGEIEDCSDDAVTLPFESYGR